MRKESNQELSVEEVKLEEQIVDSIGDNIEKIEPNIPKKSYKKIVTISSILFITCVGVLGYLANQGLLTPKSLHERYQINDSGAIQAIRSDFIQEIGVSHEYKGLTFTVDHIIVDEKRLMILYTIKSNRKKGFLNNIYYEISDGEGKRLPLSQSYPLLNMDLSKHKTYQDHLSFVFNESKIPERIQLDLNLQTSESDTVTEPEDSMKEDKTDNSYEWHVSIPVDHKPFQDKKIVYDLQKSCMINNQKIHIDGLTIYPTIAVVSMRYDPQNTKKIFELVDFKIMDGSKAFTRGVDGLLSAGSDHNLNMYFESNYFETDNKKLSLTGTGIRALDKDKLKVIVDIDNKKVIQSPNNQLTLDDINSNYITLRHKIDGLQFDMKFMDGEGNMHQTNSQGYSTDSEGYSNLFYLPKNKKLMSPLTLTIISYPTITEHPFEVKILE
ncbi:DUF4179 domain-containing protein [Vallitalea pronyensis]|uniref:DUF4179 domain-containing protein n=1 Tax=Vallitalea pronyensis TaxID=1348613 RepID=A0A8J8MHL1_9FIRM|nr:DUF4179 domain-containing protein [Vallitalea pronyensis]QUI21592.1 DUF4179 domain-containing protein [Vallitalea pronyensis]